MATHWYSVKTFYRSYAEGRPTQPDRFYDPDVTLVEDRILLIKAANKGEAIKKAEREAKDFSMKIIYQNHYDQDVTTRYMGVYEIFEIGDSIADKTEIFGSGRLISKRIPDRKVGNIYTTPSTKHPLHSTRKKFLNKNYTIE